MYNSLQAKLFVPCMAIFFTIQANAQPVITKENVLAIKGRTIASEMDTTGSVTVNVGMASAQAQTWDFGAVQITNPLTNSLEWLDPSTTPFTSDYPDANLSVKIHGVFEGFEVDLYNYFDVQDNAFVNLGTGASLFGLTQIARDGTRFGVLPLEYGKMWDDTTVTVTSIPFVSTTRDSVIAHSTVDAWGTVSLGGGNFECLRICSKDTPWSESSGLGGSSRDTTSTINYIWVSKADLMVVNISSQDNETDPNYTNAGIFIHATASPSTALDDPGSDFNGPTTFDLSQNFPNPFNPETKIRYSVGRAGHVELAVFDMQGKLVKVLVDQDLPVGNHTVSWNGNDTGGQKVASGRYIYRLSTNGEVKSKMMVLVK